MTADIARQLAGESRYKKVLDGIELYIELRAREGHYWCNYELNSATSVVYVYNALITKGFTVTYEHLIVGHLLTIKWDIESKLLP